MKYNVLLKGIDIESIKNYQNTMVKVSYIFQDIASKKQGNKRVTCNKIINNCEEIIDLLNNIVASTI